MAESVIVKAKIKDIAGNVSVSGDFAEALNAKVVQLVREAVARAEGNNRRTVMAKDL